MKLITLFIAVAVFALLFALFAWAFRGQQNAKVHPRRQKGLRRTWRHVALMPLFFERLWNLLPARPAPRMACGVQFANIGEGTFEHGIRSYLPDATTSARYLLYKKGSDVDHCAICGAGDDPLGPSDDQADSTTTPIAIKLLGAVKGTLRVVTDGTISDGDYLKCGATGKATKAATGDLSFGRAVIPTDASKADGDVISFRPALPAKYAF